MMAIGSTEGGIEMLKYPEDKKGPALMIILHHEDACAVNAK